VWRQFIRDRHPELEPIGGAEPGPEFFPGATPQELEAVERQVGVLLPASLKELLAESNGVLSIFGTHLIWTTGEIVRTNREMRVSPGYQERYMPFEPLLFFADAGVDGIRFAFGLIQGQIKREDIYSWNPIDDSRKWQAPSLKTYIDWWLGGELKV
jgi:hypothetical protein